jgi:hypothetical protein
MILIIRRVIYKNARKKEKRRANDLYRLHDIFGRVISGPIRRDTLLRETMLMIAQSLQF